MRVDKAGRDDGAGSVDDLGGANTYLVLPISAILPSLTAISASRRGAPVPSITVPFFISRSQAIAASPSFDASLLSPSATERESEKSGATGRIGAGPDNRSG
jgi:hypothetical protein